MTSSLLITWSCKNNNIKLRTMWKCKRQYSIIEKSMKLKEGRQGCPFTHGERKWLLNSEML